MAGRRGTRAARAATWWVSCALFAGCASAAAEVPDEGPRAEARVELATVRAETVASEAILHGRTRSVERADVSFAIAGRLQARLVDVGDRVRAGQPLARLDARGYAHAVEAAEATLRELDARREQLARDEARVATLREGGVVASAELETIRSAVARLEEGRRASAVALDEARRQRAEALLRAPFDGVVRAVLAEEGAVLGPGAPVLWLSAEGPAEVELELPERVARWARVDDPVTIELPSTGERFEGVLAARSDAAGPTGLFPARVRFEGEPNVGSGRGALIVLRGREALASELRVPLRAVVDPSGDRPFVWRVGADAIATRVEVRPLGLRGDELALEAHGELALHVGDRVVVAGHWQVLPGDRVAAIAEPTDTDRGATTDTREIAAGGAR